MAQKIHRIKLGVEERQQLEALIAAGKAAAGKRQRAQILLCADENPTQGGLKDRDIARAVGVCRCRPWSAPVPRSAIMAWKWRCMAGRCIVRCREASSTAGPRHIW